MDRLDKNVVATDNVDSKLENQKMKLGFGGRSFGVSSGRKSFTSKSPMSALDKFVDSEAKSGSKEDEMKCEK